MQKPTRSAIKNILLISYHYHPDVAVGAQRTIKLAKYLPEFGWQPHVLTVRPEFYQEQSLSPSEVACPVHRTGSSLRPDDIYDKLKKLLHRGGADHQKGDPAETFGNASANRPSILKRLYNSLNLTPDEAVGWYLPASRAAVRLSRKHHYDIIFSSGPPHTCHLVGLRTHLRTGIPWVVDFRDPWVGPRKDYTALSGLSRIFDEHFQRRSVEAASLVLTTTPEWANKLGEMFPSSASKCVALLNGFDSDDFSVAPPRQADRESRTITFFHGGTLYVGRNPSALLEAVGILKRQASTATPEFRFDFYGNVEIDQSKLQEIVAADGLENIVKFSRSVDRSDYLRLLAGSDVLILFQADMARLQIPAKTFEYLATGKPILALVSEGATRNFLSKYKHVAIAHPERIDEIGVAIAAVMEMVSSGTVLRPDDPALTSLTKRKLTEKFATLLGDIVE